MVLFRAKQKLGKYQIERRLAEGSFADVYRALDTLEGVRVALKIPHKHLLTREVLDYFRKEVRLMAALDHPHILPLKDASFIDAHFVIAVPLGEQTLSDRLAKRLALRTVLDYAEQMLDAVAYAHHNRIIHCDIKPENFILFPDNRLRLGDFGISKVARRTIQASGSGTVGYMAPEQAMGKPSFRSDVFSLGLILYRMFSGHLPEWPYEWPPPGYARLRGRIHPDLIGLLKRAVEFQPRRRFRDAEQMRASFRQARRKATNGTKMMGTRTSGGIRKKDWQTVRRQQFQRQYGKSLETRFECQRCRGPVAESMLACPWCGAARPVHRDETSFPTHCPRCRRGMKSDWRYCPWCYGPGFEPAASRQYSDARYQAQCSNSRCRRKVLMPFMRYCPWCRGKVRRKWTAPGSTERCSSCGWGVFKSFWDFCPWCGKSLHGR